MGADSWYDDYKLFGYEMCLEKTEKGTIMLVIIVFFTSLVNIQIINGVLNNIEFVGW